MSNKKYNILVVKDENESHHIKKERIFDVPFRLLLIAKSQQGKSNLAVNLITREEYYKSDFKPEDIYIFSPSIKNDAKLKKAIKYLDIPRENLFNEYDTDLLEALYDNIQEDYEEAINDNKKPVNSLIFMDDLSFSGDLKKAGIVPKIFMNGRHINLSIIITAQKYSDIATGIRENATGAFIWPCSSKQLELINDDLNYTTKPKKEFIRIFRQHTPKRYNFICINFSNDKEEMYLDSEFNPIEELNNSIQ